MSSFEVRDRGWLFDLTLSSVLALVLVTASHSDPPVAVASLALCCSLMFRRGHPNLALTVGIAGAVALLVVSTMPEPAIVVVPILVYSLARWAPGSQGRIAFGAGLVGSLLGPIRWAQPYLNQDRLGTVALFAVVCAALVIGAFLLGSRLRESRQRDRERVAEAARARGLVEAERDQRSEMAAISERARIARELHDIVAHSLSVIVVQADGGRALAVRTKPEIAPQVLATIAETSRDALAEMRHMVAVLRAGDDRVRPTRTTLRRPRPPTCPTWSTRSAGPSDGGAGRLRRAAAAGRSGRRADDVPGGPGVADQRAQARRARVPGHGSRCPTRPT